MKRLPMVELFAGLFALSLVFFVAGCGGTQPIAQKKAAPTVQFRTTETFAETSTPSQQEPTTVVGTATLTTTTIGTSTATPVVTATTSITTTTPTPTPAPMSMADIDLQAGRHLYGEVCAPCHGLRATGIEGIGIDLTQSKFVRGLDEEQLAQFLLRGLSINSPFNTTNIKMPPRGGRNDLSDQEILNVSAYLKSINTQKESDPARIAEYLDWVKGDGAKEVEATPEVGKEGLTGLALEGQTTYLRFCSVCHGPNGEGVESLGNGFRNSEFIAKLTDKKLAEFIKQGRPADDPLNKTGIEMLPYGGQAYLTDEELTRVVAYIRAINTGKFIPPVSLAQDVSKHDDDQEHQIMEEKAFEIINAISPKCFACHLISDQGNKNGPGPDLNGLKDRAGTRKPGMSAVEYVKESILDPGAFLVKECPRGTCVDVMVKNYAEKITDEQLNTLVQFLLSLPSDTAEETDATTTPTATNVVTSEVTVRAVDLIGQWVDTGAKNGKFQFVAANGMTYTTDFDTSILPLFVTPGAWYPGSQACVECHYDNSTESYHEMNLGSYEGIITGGDPVSNPPGVPIIIPHHWADSILRHRLRDTRMPPGWEFVEDESNRNGPVFMVNGGETHAVDLIGAWVNAGAKQGKFAFQATDGVTYTATFEEDVLRFFTEPNMWYKGSSACTECHYENSEKSYHEMDLTSYEGILKGADSVSNPPGVPILVPGHWDKSVLRDRLRNTRMPPGWEWDITEENRNGPDLNVHLPADHAMNPNAIVSVQPMEAQGEGAIHAVDLIGAWVDSGAKDGEFPFTGIDGKDYIGNFNTDILPLFTKEGAWYPKSEACTNCHYANAESSYHEMDLSSHQGILTGADPLSSPPGVPMFTVGEWATSTLRHRLRDTRMPPGWEFFEDESNRDGPTITVNGGKIHAVDLIGAWVNAGAKQGKFAFQAINGITYTATFEDNVLRFFTEPNMWYKGSSACTECHFETSDKSYHEMFLGSYEGIITGADSVSNPPGVPIIIPGDWDNSILRDRLRNTRMPPKPGWEWDITEENRDGPTVMAGHAK